MARLTVADLMTEKVFAVSENDTLATVSDLMDSLHVRHIPVIDKEGGLLGMISQRDLIRDGLFSGREVPLSQKRYQLERRKAGEHMTVDVETITPEEEAAEAGRILLENKFGALPVVDGTRLVGIITESDFVRYVAENADTGTGTAVA